MSPDTAKAHAEVIRKIAAEFDAIKSEGAEDVAFLCKRAARLIEAIGSESDVHTDKPHAVC